MVVEVASVAFEGVRVVPVAVQAQLTPGLPAFSIVGLGDKAVAESRERVRGALHAMGIAIPAKKVVVNLAPADLQKEGSHYDLPVALALLGALGVLPQNALDEALALGELGLDGRLHPIAGVLPAAMYATETSRSILCPAGNGMEAAWAAPGGVVAAPDLLTLVNHLRGQQLLSSPRAAERELELPKVDLAHVRGQELAKRALEITAAGGHNLLMSGPPGAGKSMLAACLPGILPPLEAEEMLEVSMVASVAGKLDKSGLASARPFRDPHHSSSVAAMVGGGRKALPGEISLAHHGVLFLDEFPEFPRAVLEALRQPLETGTISVARAQAHVQYPAQCQLVAAMNPCRCGYLADPSRACARAPQCGKDYSAKLSGPLLDRIDLVIEVQALETTAMLQTADAEPSAQVRARVLAARQTQRGRAEGLGLTGTTNAALRGEAVAKACKLDPQAQALMERALAQLKLSMRAYTRTLKVARTIADLAASDEIGAPHVAEALSYRGNVLGL